MKPGDSITLEGHNVTVKRVELRELGYVADSGRRRLTPSKQRATVWVITPAGVEALREWAA